MDELKRLLTTVNTRSIYAYSILIGIAAGLAAAVFNDVLHALSSVTMDLVVGIAVPEPAGEAHGAPLAEAIDRRWALVLLPVVGGLVSGLLVKTFAPEAEGTGTDSYIDAFHNRAGAIRSRVPIVKSLATIATIACGGSAGKEGPIAQIGAGVGSSLGKYIEMGARARRTLMIAGAAAGLSAIFRAPLGGALTAVEVLYKEDLETDALTPAILSSITAYTVFCSINGFDHVFAFEVVGFHSPIELVFYAILGCVCSLSGFLFVRFFHGSKRRFFGRLPVNRYLIPPIGGLLVGAIGYGYPQVLGGGFGYVQELIQGSPVGGMQATAASLILLGGLKIVTTSFTISSGGSGGVFAPSLFIGAMIGGAVGTLCHDLFPELAPQVAPFVVVGMGGFFAGVANAPIASLMMVCELTGAYELLPPLMIVATIALAISRKWSIYESQVDNKFMSRAHVWEMNPVILRRTTISDAVAGQYKGECIVRVDAPLSEVAARTAESGARDLVVVDRDGRLAGSICMREIEFDRDVGALDAVVVAADLVNRRPFSLSPESSLVDAMEYFGQSDLTNLPIKASAAGGAPVIGYVDYDAILAFYRTQQVEGASRADESEPTSEGPA